MIYFILLLTFIIPFKLYPFTYSGEQDAYVFIPGFSYDSNRGIKINGTGLYYDKSNSKSFPNSFKINFSFGSNGEFSFGIGTARYFHNLDYKLSIYAQTGKYINTLYYPLTGENIKKEKENYLTNNNYFKISIGARRLKYFYLGTAYTFSYYKFIEKEKNGIIDNNKITGAENTIASGIGFFIIRERRENSYYPTRGYYLGINNYLYPTFLGSDTFYDTTALSFKYFKKIFYKVIFAYQFYTRAVFGKAPFQKISKLGGISLLRGYTASKYADKRYLATQAELRFPVFKKISGVLFLGTAQVTDSFLNYFDYSWKVSWGSGLRFRMDEKQNINIRLDFAWNIEGDFYIYITSLEAF